MSVNGKREGFAANDLVEFARFCNMKATRARRIIGEVMAGVEHWPELARRAGVAPDRAGEVERHFRTWLA